MDPPTLNEFVYALHYKLEAMEAWARSTNECAADHAMRIDALHGEGIVVAAEIRRIQGELNDMATTDATAEADTRQVMAMVENSFICIPIMKINVERFLTTPYMLKNIKQLFMEPIWILKIII